MRGVARSDGAPAGWDVVVVGGANTDYVIHGPALPSPGGSVQGDRFLRSPGGKGLNQAVAAARLGARIAMVARLGSDARGDAALDTLRREGVDTGCILRDAEAPTGAAVIQVGAEGRKQTMGFAGANARLTTDDVRAAGGVIRRARVLLVQLETPLACARAAAELAHAAGVLVVLDPAPAAPLPDERLGVAAVVRPNSFEAEVITGVPVRDRASARRAALALLDRGAGAACVQAGEEGDLLVWRAGERWLPRLPVRSVDTTGAGDAFAAAMAVMLAEAKPLTEAAAFGNLAAALATTRLGALPSLPRRSDVLALRDRLAAGATP
ncbi:MAG TPA: PfkB family carbohydrate kinase [Gemmatimonadaceae bacterium]|nr:PfkB family carbohydrate kinase [Gemmatimonadaceae bacterium]